MAQDYYGVPPHLRRTAAQAKPATDAQVRCDAIQAEVRAETPRRSIRREPPPRPPDIPVTDDAIALRLAEEIEYARRMLDNLGNGLAADPTVVARHLVSLQSVDVVGQILGHIATIVRSSDPAASIERIGMADLRARLLRRGGV